MISFLYSSLFTISSSFKSPLSIATPVAVPMAAPPTGEVNMEETTPAATPAAALTALPAAAFAAALAAAMDTARIAFAPSFDLSSLDGEIPVWLKWIVDNKDVILSVMAGVTAGLLAWKLGLSGLKALGIGVAIAGIVYTIQAIIDYLKDPSWENFGKIITGIGVAIAGIAIAFGAWPVAVVGAIVAVVGIIASYWEQIKAFFQSGIDWLTGKSSWVHEVFGDTIGTIYDLLVNCLQQILN